MKKQIIITSAMLTGLVFLLTGNAWAEPDRRRGRGEDKQYHDRGDRRPDRTVKPDRGRKWHGRQGHRDPSGHWTPKNRHHVRKHHDRRWHRRKPHAGPRHHWRQDRRHHRSRHWRPWRHHRPHHFRRSGPPRRRHAHRHAGLPVIATHVYHHDDQAESISVPTVQFEIAASTSDPAGLAFSLGISAVT